LKLLEDKLEELEDNKNKDEKDVEKVKDRYEKKLNDLKIEKDTEIGRLTGLASKSLVETQAMALATKLAGKNAAILLPHIQKRITADLTGDEGKTVVLDGSGKPTTLTLEKLSEEFIANKDFSSIIIGSKATGGAGGKSGGATNQGANIPGNQEQKPPVLAKLPPKDLAAQLRAKKEEGA
jgi:hypothetical protein